MRTSRTARLIDVAKAAGVSLGAASTVINGGKTSIQVGEESRRRILEAARQLKYRPNLTARADWNRQCGYFAIFQRRFCKSYSFCCSKL